MIKKEDSTGKNLLDDVKGIGSVLSLCTVGKKGNALQTKMLTSQLAK